MTTIPEPAVADPARRAGGERRPLRVALVLGGGGTVGAAYHAGVLSSLQIDLGWDARDAALVVGTSAGALVGAMLRLGLPPDDVAAVLVDGRMREAPAIFGDVARGPDPFAAGWGRGMLRAARVPPPRAALRAILRFSRLGDPSGLVGAFAPPGDADLEAFTAVLRRDDARWPTGLRVCAVDADTLRRRVFGRVADSGGATAPTASRHSTETVALETAVAASCAVPGLARPVRIGGRRYLDGGVHSPTNADVVLHEKSDDGPFDLVIVSSPMSGSARSGPLGAMRALARRALARELSRIRAAGIPVVVFQPSRALAVEMGWDLLARGREAHVLRHSLLEAGQLIAGRSHRALLAGLAAGTPAPSG